MKEEALCKKQKKMNLMQLTFIVAVNMMGSGIIMLPTNMAQGRRDLAAVLDRDGARLDGHRLRVRAGRHLQPAPRRHGRLRRGRLRQGRATSRCSSCTSCRWRSRNVAIAISARRLPRRVLPWLSSTPIATCIGVIALLWLTTVANFGGPSLTGRIGSVTVWGVILPVGLISIIGWFWFKGDTFAAAWNPQGLSLGEGHGLEHRAHAVGLPRHGVGGAELGRGGEPEAQRAARLHVRHARRRRDLHPVDDGDPGHRAERRAGEIDRPVRPRLRPDVQPDGRLHRHGAGGDGLPRLAARLAVHARQTAKAAADERMFPAFFAQGEPRWARRSPA